MSKDKIDSETARLNIKEGRLTAFREVISECRRLAYEPTASAYRITTCNEIAEFALAKMEKENG